MGINEQFLKVLHRKAAILSRANTFLRDTVFNGDVAVSGVLTVNGPYAEPLGSELTIASGEITVTGAVHEVDTQADAASDDLDTINGGADGYRLTLRPASTARTVVLKHGTGNINTFDGGDVTLDDIRKKVELWYDDANSVWLASSSGVELLDEDDMASDSAVKGATQQSIKAYVDNELAGADFLTSVSQGDLNTSTGAVSNNGGDTETETDLTLPGGSYGFYPQIKGSASAVTYLDSELQIKFGKALTESYVARISIGWDSCGNAGPHIVYAQQRYVTASPPIDLGDGEMAGFVFLDLDENGTIISSYIADVPPWVYNGPTRVFPDYIDRKTGKKYRKVRKQRSIEEILDGVKPSKKVTLQEITQDIKNADMPLLPHPFPGLLPGHKVIMLDTQSSILRDLIDEQNAGREDVLEIIEKYIDIDNEPTDLISPPGVTTHKFKKKQEKKI